MEIDFAHVFATVSNLVENNYGIPVRIVEFSQGFSGDLNGAEIFINKNKSTEEQLFNLVHLFGHTVQWAIREDGYKLGEKLYILPDEALLKRLIEYEREAARYSVSLLIEAGENDLIQWISEYSDCDIRFLEHFYKTNEILPFDFFRIQNESLITEIPIPAFKPIRRTRRVGGIVLSATT
jgi:hypothetical protein